MLSVTFHVQAGYTVITYCWKELLTMVVLVSLLQCFKGRGWQLTENYDKDANSDIQECM